MNNIRLMTHLVAGYPSDEAAFEVAKAMVEGGAAILEVQLPFSDPSADGVAIQTACARVLKRNYTTSDGLKLIAKIHTAFPKIPIFVMTYASICYALGVENFVRKIAENGASGAIIPDLPFDSDEGLTNACKAHNVANIPVIAPSINSERLQKIVDLDFEYIYAALRTGITGQETIIDAQTIEFINSAKIKGAKILGGFGIATAAQSRALAPHVHAVIAGSVFVRIISEGERDYEGIYKKVRENSRELAGG